MRTRHPRRRPAVDPRLDRVQHLKWSLLYQRYGRLGKVYDCQVIPTYLLIAQRRTRASNPPSWPSERLPSTPSVLPCTSRNPLIYHESYLLVMNEENALNALENTLCAQDIQSWSINEYYHVAPQNVRRLSISSSRPSQLSNGFVVPHFDIVCLRRISWSRMVAQSSLAPLSIGRENGGCKAMTWTHRSILAST